MLKGIMVVVSSPSWRSWATWPTRRRAACRRTCRRRRATSTSPGPGGEVEPGRGSGWRSYVQLNGVAPANASERREKRSGASCKPSWPQTNPFTQAPMTQGKEPADIAYAPGAGTAYTLGVVVSARPACTTRREVRCRRPGRARAGRAGGWRRGRRTGSASGDDAL